MPIAHRAMGMAPHTGCVKTASAPGHLDTRNRDTSVARRSTSLALHLSQEVERFAVGGEER